MRPVSAGPLRKRQRLKVKAAVPLENETLLNRIRVAVVNDKVL